MEAGKLLFGHLKALIKASKKFNEQGVSIRRRLVLYWVSMVLALFLIFILVLNLIGTFSKTERELSAFLELQERNTSAALSNHLSELTAQGIILSKEISKKMSNLLTEALTLMNLMTIFRLFPSWRRIYTTPFIRL